MLAVFLIRSNRAVPAASERFTASHVYWLLTHWLDVLAVRLTSLTQRGSLPFYLAVILAVTDVYKRQQLSWLPQLGLDLTFRMDQLSWLFALLVTGAGALVLLYCRSYFDAVSYTHLDVYKRQILCCQEKHRREVLAARTPNRHRWSGREYLSLIHI